MPSHQAAISATRICSSAPRSEPRRLLGRLIGVRRNRICDRNIGCRGANGDQGHLCLSSRGQRWFLVTVPAMERELPGNDGRGRPLIHVERNKTMPHSDHGIIKDEKPRSSPPTSGAHRLRISRHRPICVPRSDA